MVSGGSRIRPQEDSLNNPVDLVVGTPGRVLQHIEEGNMVYGEIKYVVSIVEVLLSNALLHLREIFHKVGYLYSRDCCGLVGIG